MREFSRTERVADFLKKELGGLIQTQMRDPRVFMTSVTDVVVSRDMSHAKVYVTVMGQESAEEAKETIKVLNGAAGFLRSQIAKFNAARHTPTLRFYYDSSVIRGNKLSSLIEKAVEADKFNQQADEDSKDNQD